MFTYSAMNIDTNLPLIIWAHGWGHSHKSFEHFIPPFAQTARHIMLDFPGFGDSPEPPEHWGTKEHADAIAAWLKEEGFPPVIWIGHSYGCRMGTQLAAHYPEAIKAMVYIGGAGLKTPRPLWKRTYLYMRIKLFKALKRFAPESKLRRYLGSRDYNQTSGVMRKIFVRVVNEDLVEEAAKVTCPVALIYGQNDTETPPCVGKKYAKLMNKATLHILGGQDHYTVLQTGRHRVIKIISEFLNGI